MGDRRSKTELPTRGMFHEPQQFATCSEDGDNCCKTKVNSSPVAALGVQKPILRPTGRRHQQDAGRGRQQLSETVTGKYQCQFIVGIEEERKFKVMRKLLGPSGANMRAIVDRTGAKLRLRGKGSRFLEGPDQVESSDPLMLCISVTYRRSYDVAVSMAWALMERVHQEYRGFCFRSGREVPELHVQVHEGARQVHDDACVLVFNASVCDRQASHRLCIAEFARAPVFLAYLPRQRCTIVHFILIGQQYARRTSRSRKTVVNFSHQVRVCLYLCSEFIVSVIPELISLL